MMRTFNEVKISGIIWLTVHDKPVNKDKIKMMKRIVQFDMSLNKTIRNLNIRKEAIYDCMRMTVHSVMPFRLKILTNMQ